MRLPHTAEQMGGFVDGMMQTGQALAEASGITLAAACCIHTWCLMMVLLIARPPVRESPCTWVVEVGVIGLLMHNANSYQSLLRRASVAVIPVTMHTPLRKRRWMALVLEADS